MQNLCVLPLPPPPLQVCTHPIGPAHKAEQSAFPAVPKGTAASQQELHHCVVSWSEGKEAALEGVNPSGRSETCLFVPPAQVLEAPRHESSVAPEGQGLCHWVMYVLGPGASCRCPTAIKRGRIEFRAPAPKEETQGQPQGGRAQCALLGATWRGFKTVDQRHLPQPVPSTSQCREQMGTSQLSL